MKIPKYWTTVTTFSKTIALILFIALPFIGFWIGVSYQQMLDLNKNYSYVLPLKPNKPSSSFVDTSVWQTYSSSSGFTFKYPTISDYYLNIIKTSQPYIQTLGPESSLLFYKKNPNSTSPVLFSIMINSINSNESFDQFIEDWKKSFEQGYLVNFGKSIQNPKVSNTTVANRNAIDLINYTEPNSEDIFVQFPNSERVLQVKKSGAMDSEFPGLFQQILSTFIFINQDQINTPTPTCRPRPACLDSTPRCLIAEPVNGWCK